MQEGVHQEDAALMDLERPLHYRREEEIKHLKEWRFDFTRNAWEVGYEIFLDHLL